MRQTHTSSTDNLKLNLVKMLSIHSDLYREKLFFEACKKIQTSLLAGPDNGNERWTSLRCYPPSFF